MHLVIDLFHPGVSLLVQVRQRGEGDPRPEVLFDETDGRLNFAFVEKRALQTVTMVERKFLP
jgi:hypothetical protein